MIYSLWLATLWVCNQLQRKKTMPATIGHDYYMRPITYRTKEDAHFTLYVVAKSEDEYQTHVKNMKNAGFDVTTGESVIAIKLEKEPPLSYAEILRGGKSKE